jgi:hypothetical protein
MAGYLCPMPIGILFANGILSLLATPVRCLRHPLCKQPNCILSLQTAFCLSASSLQGRNKKREGTSAMEALSLYAVFFLQ